MKIEVAKEGRMDMSGQGLIRAIQNNNMPLLDLLVREAVQNSLDAARPKEDVVQVDFGVKDFSASLLAAELEGITEALREDFPKRRYKYLYIRDRGTEGLTGPLHFSDKRTEEKQNLLKLVYEIAKPQDEKDAGGSWGYGKTIYYRIGIGLVFYYSKIKTSDGKYQSRLAVCLVEDEKNPNSLLRDKSLNSSRGLAWWGQKYTYKIGDQYETGTIPETDPDRIEEILSIFDFEPFDRNETGTAVLIPYINERKLLTNNIPQEGRRLPWGDDIEEYIKIAVQRWYIGRLNNPEYNRKHSQPWLEVSVNDETVGPDDIAEPFAEIQKLYNMALFGQVKENEGGYYCESVKLNGYFESTTAGFVAYKMYSPGEMGMLPPVNNPNPFVFVKNEDGAEDYKNGDIILSYFRKPGMSVTYDTAGEWVNKIKCNNENSGDVLIAVFVLNSANRFKHEGIKEFSTIEEYFRASERADHTAWYDINVNDLNPRFLIKMQRQIGKKISERFKKPEEKSEEKSSSLSKMFGEFLLPPQGFGKAASSSSGKTGKGSTGIIRHKNTSLKIDNKKLSIFPDHIIIPVVMKSDKPVSNTVYSLEASAEGNNIPIQKWSEKTGIREPFYIQSVTFEEITGNGVVILKNVVLNDEKNGFRSKSCAASFIKTTTGINYGISVNTEVASFSASMKVDVAVRDRMVQLGYVLSEGE